MFKFEDAYSLVLRHEGGISDHPADKGGLTKWGVTQATYTAYLRGKNAVLHSVRNMTRTECEEIYRENYWRPVQGDNVPWALAYVLFDGAVNSGVAQSVKWLQRSLGLRVDGVFGPVTLAAVNGHTNINKLINTILDRRLAFLSQLKNFKVFGRGWTARVGDVRSLAIAAHTTNNLGVLNVATPVISTSKANLENAKPQPTTSAGDALTGLGAITTAISEAQGNLAALGGSTFATNALTALTVAGVIAVVVGVILRVRSKRKAAERADALDLVAA